MSDHYFQGITASLSHWAGSFQTTKCTPLPANSASSWVWENPCVALGPIAGSTKGFFYLDDSSNNVVLGSAIFANLDEVRRVFPLAWRSTDTIFRLSVPISYQEKGARSLNGPVENTLLGNGMRVTTFTVIARTPTTLSGNFEVATVSGYRTVTSLSFIDYWTVTPTSASGTWSASLINAPVPQTFMNGFDFCFNDNQAVKQMPANSLSNPIISPVWAGGFVQNGCRF